MSPDHQTSGGAAVAALTQVVAWEANLVLYLRLWCDGQKGQLHVWNAYRRALPAAQAREACRSFELLVNDLIDNAHRPFFHHDVGCACVGADESAFVPPVRTASESHLTDAALIATLITGPARAEHIAILAGEVGICVLHIHRHLDELPTRSRSNVIRLHSKPKEQ